MVPIQPPANPVAADSPDESSRRSESLPELAGAAGTGHASDPSWSSDSGSHTPVCAHHAASTNGELQRLLSQHQNWERDLSTSALRHAVELLSAKARRHGERLRELDETQARLIRRLTYLGDGPVFTGQAAALNALAAADETLSVVDAQERLRQLEFLVTSVHQDHQKLLALLGRLGEQPTQIHLSQPIDLTAVQLELAAQLETVERQVIELGQREREATLLFDRLSEADLDTAQPGLEDSARVLEAIRWLISDRPLIGDGQRYRSLRGGLELPSVLLAALWHIDPDKGRKLLGEQLPKSLAQSPGSLMQLLAFMRFEHIRDGAEHNPAVAAATAHCVFAMAYQSGQDNDVSFFEPLVVYVRNSDKYCAAFYEALVAAVRRGYGLIDSLKQARASMVPVSGKPAGTAKQELQQKLLTKIRHSPGMTGLYQLLRAYVQNIYLRKLEHLIDQGDAQAVLTQWRSYGSLDTMLERVIAESGKRNLDDSHRQQTARYIDEFDELIESWASAMAPVQAVGSSSVLQIALRSVEEHASENVSCSALQLTLTELESGKVPSVPADFGKRTIAGDQGELLVEHPAMFDLQSLRCFALQTSGQRPSIWRYVSDLIAQRLGTAPADPGQAVERLLAWKRYSAALRAAGEDSELIRKVRETTTQRAARLRTEHEALLSEALLIRANSEEISTALDYIDEAFECFDYRIAGDLLVELAVHVQRYRQAHDPERKEALEFLHELGESALDDAPLPQIKERVERHKRDHKERRKHLEILEYAIDDICSSPNQRESLRGLAHRLDRPSMWPQPVVAQELEQAISTFAEFIQARLRFDTDPGSVFSLQERLPRWLCHHMIVGLSTPSRQDGAKPILELARDIRRFCPIEHVLRKIGTTMPMREADGVSARSTSTNSLNSLDSPHGGQSGDSQRLLLNELIDSIQQHFPQDPQPVTEDRTRLISACQEGDWPQVRKLAAALERASHGSSSAGDLLSVFLALHAISLAQASLPTDLFERGRILRSAVLSIAFAHERLGAYISEDARGTVLTRAIVAMVEPAVTSDPTNAEVLTRALDRLTELEAVEVAYQWLAELLWTSSQIPAANNEPMSIRIGNMLWDLLKAQSSAQARSFLLHTLYRMRRTEVLRGLARRARPHDDLIIACLDSYARAESDMEVRPQALQLSAAFRAQAAGKANTKPWLLLFARLDSPRRNEDGHPLRCTLETDLAADMGDGCIELQLRIEPTLTGDPAEQLTLHLQNETPRELLPPGEFLLQEQLVVTRLPLHSPSGGDNVLQVPYRLTGRTLANRTIDLRGTFTLLCSTSPISLLTDEEIRQAWPGASGDPVLADHFFGRQREIREIETRIRDDNRQRSAMLIGQRRIGKTSLLLEMVRNLPPEPGKVCGIFIDASGLNLPAGESMHKALFEHILTALDSREANKKVQQVLRENGIQESKYLARGLQTELSLFDALERLLDRIRERTRGQIARLALFIDEFDRFVEPLLTERRNEVDNLMWNIRQIVQQSHDLSLVLAGSGLQRLIFEHYNAPLYGSIDRVELEPFDWTLDKSAILDTFVPSRLRERLLGTDHADSVVRHAYNLSGGNPYYLALLGYRSVLLSKGRPLSAPLVSRAAELLIHGKSNESSWRIESNLLYGHIFETLKRVPVRRQALARLLLTHLAQRTTAEYPWLTYNDALDAPALLQLSDEEERENALKNLEQDRVLEVEGLGNSRRVRVRVPLTLEALRWDAGQISQEALGDLKRRSRLGGSA